MKQHPLIENANTVLVEKAKEYAFTNRYDNFISTEVILGINPFEALLGFTLKHFMSVHEMLCGRLPITYRMVMDKLGDSYNYMILGYGMLINEQNVMSLIDVPNTPETKKKSRQLIADEFYEALKYIYGNKPIADRIKMGYFCMTHVLKQMCDLFLEENIYVPNP